VHLVGLKKWQTDLNLNDRSNSGVINTLVFPIVRLEVELTTTVAMNAISESGGRDAIESGMGATLGHPRDLVSKFRRGAPKVRTGCRTCK